MNRAPVAPPLLFALALSGCASTLSGVGGADGYACKAPEGAMCTSVSGVYANTAQNIQRPTKPAEKKSPPATPAIYGATSIAPGKPARLNSGQSYFMHIPDSRIAAARGTSFEATTDYSRVAEADALIICVPTPLNPFREPDLSFIIDTMESILPHLRAGQLVSLESTTYPGTTEEELKPRIEAMLGNIAKRRPANISDIDRYLLLDKGQSNEENLLDGSKILSSFDSYRVLAGDRVISNLDAMPAKAQRSIDLLRQPSGPNQGELVWRLGLVLGSANLLLLGIGLAATNPRRPSNWNVLMALLAFVVYYNIINLTKAWVAGAKLGMGTALALTHGSALAIALGLLWWRDSRNSRGRLRRGFAAAVFFPHAARVLRRGGDERARARVFPRDPAKPRRHAERARAPRASPRLAVERRRRLRAACWLRAPRARCHVAVRREIPVRRRMHGREPCWEHGAYAWR